MGFVENQAIRQDFILDLLSLPSIVFKLPKLFNVVRKFEKGH